jgi:NAD(P)-dependent dehydrogenase (short-subunit alcohol dehydrogenase family)
MATVGDRIGAQRTVVVTGGNRGLGLETARGLAARAFRVVVTARDLAAGRAVARQIGDRAEARALDVTDPESIAALADGLRRDPGRLFAVVDNAGISLRGYDAEVVDRTLAVNFAGARDVADALSPLLDRGGNLVMVSSGLGELSGLPARLVRAFSEPEITRARIDQLIAEFREAVRRGSERAQGWPRSGYRVSKIALNALTRVLARELAPRGVKVNAVCPGWVRTDLGGERAPRSVEEGASGIVWAATLGDEAPSGGFFRDAEAIPW